jgi:uncharacterized membrane protein YphA (DoxX/SURF4 family)
MQSSAPTAPVNKPMLWTGRVISALPVLMLLMSGAMKFTKSPDVAKMMEHLGWPPNVAIALGITEITCTVLYAIPQTSVLGAILLTGYMGGAIATHARLGEPFYIQAGIGVLVWLGLYLREPRLRALLPLRR